MLSLVAENMRWLEFGGKARFMLLTKLQLRMRCVEARNIALRATEEGVDFDTILSDIADKVNLAVGVVLGLAG